MNLVDVGVIDVSGNDAFRFLISFSELTFNCFPEEAIIKQAKNAKTVCFKALFAIGKRFCGKPGQKHMFDCEHIYVI